MSLDEENRSLDEDLRVKSRELLLKHHALQEEGGRLAIFVAEHFNTFVREVINPQLQQGYSIAPSQLGGVVFSEGKFEITTGCYMTPRGPTTQAQPLMERIEPLLDQYKGRAPWISRIHYGFDLAR